MSSPSRPALLKRELSSSDDGCMILSKRPRSNDTDMAAVGPASISDNSPSGDATLHEVKNPEIKTKGAKADANDKKSKKRRRKMFWKIEAGSRDYVFWHETLAILGKGTVESAITAGEDWDAPFEHREEVELCITRLSSNGEGLAVAPSSMPPWVVVVPFALPNEVVRCRVYRNSRLHSFADLLEVLSPNSELRDMNHVQCKYFGTCAGCQYQMISYEHQLNIKRTVIRDAYDLFSGLKRDLIPCVPQTLPSPLQYGYRTKITPHFDAPRKAAKEEKSRRSEASGIGIERSVQKRPKIGFNKMGTREVIDIEECPIATPVLNEALPGIRDSIYQNWHTYKKGVSLLLRESVVDLPEDDGEAEISEERICITDHRAQVRERVDKILFEYPAGSFFQNNNSVLPSLLKFVSESIAQTEQNSLVEPQSKIRLTHLVDAYCGCGLFSLSLARDFDKVVGIELSADSISSANRNAQLNGLTDRVEFRVGDASHIFDAVKDFPPARTAVIIDPPRKGCGENFLQQLLLFRSSVVVYVSCNVHTQARDVGFLLNESRKGEQRGCYELTRLQGFDLFPQTAHVESVAVLRLVFT